MPILTLALALAAPPVEAGFVALFDGRSFDGWVITGNPAGWQIRDGVLHSDNGAGGGWLRTAREYADYELLLEYRHSKVGNSGIQVRGAFEVQILAPWTPPRDDLHCTASLYGHVAPQRRPPEEGLVWRTMRILARNRRIEIDVDGERCTTADLEQVPGLANAPLKGPIMLQDSHSAAGEWIEFRNLRLRDLDTDPAFVAENLASDDPAIRAVAEWAASKAGPGLLPRALELAGSDEIARARVARGAAYGAALAAVGEGRADAERALLAALGDQHPEPVRRLAVELLGLVGGEASVPAVAALLNEPALRDEALAALVRLPGATPTLVRAVEAAAPERLPALIDAVAQRGDPAAVTALEVRCHEGPAEVRAAALRALGRLGEAAAIETLKAATEATEPAVVAAAVDGLLDLAGRLRASDQHAAMSAYRAAWFAAPTPAQRAAALTGRVDTNDPEALDLVIEALGDEALARVASGLLLGMSGRTVTVAVAKLWFETQVDRALLLRWMARHEPDRFAQVFVAEAGAERPDGTRALALRLLAEIAPTEHEALFTAALAAEGEVRAAGLAGLLAVAEAARARGDRAAALARYHQVVEAGAGGREMRWALEGIAAYADVSSWPLLTGLLDRGAWVGEASLGLLPLADQLLEGERRAEALAALERIARWQPALPARDGAVARLKAHGIVIDLAREDGFITHWYIIGLFPRAPADDEPLLPPNPVDVTQPVRLGDRELAWRYHHETKSEQGVVELLDLFPDATNCAAYAYAEVTSEGERDVLLKLGSDDGYRLWLNGEAVGRFDGGRMMKVDEETIPARLVAGVNRILFRVDNGGSRWAFALRITDPAGKPLLLPQREGIMQ